MNKHILMFTDTWGVGGIEQVILASSRTVLDAGASVTLYANSKWSSLADETLDSMGVKTVYGSDKYDPSLLSRHKRGVSCFTKLLKQEKFDVVHVHAMNGTGYIYVNLAKRAGVPIRILHSHNTSFGSGHNLLKVWFNFFARHLYQDCPTVRIACSNDAGRYLFGNKHFSILNNCVDVERFRFSENVRAETRNEFNISPDKKVVGVIGRITDQKNPKKVLAVFKTMHDINENIILMMVGDGDSSEEVSSIVNAYGLNGCVVRIPATNNPERYYSCFDLYLFPSKFEGLGIAAIEAQCSGLPVLMSDSLPEEVRATDLAVPMSLNRNDEEWALQGLKMLDSTNDRKHYSECSSLHEFSFTVFSRSLKSFYWQS